MIDRRGLLKFFPLAPLAFRVGEDEKIVTTHPLVAQADKPMRTIFCFRFTKAVDDEAKHHVFKQARDMLDNAGFADSLAFVLPVGLELDVFCVPKEQGNVRTRND